MKNNSKIIGRIPVSLDKRKLKVCGMKYLENIQQIGALLPDYLGFIFYEKSKRNFEGMIPELPKFIKKVGVFVDEYVDIVASLVKEYDLQVVQLHGNESVDYIENLKILCQSERIDESEQLEIIKVFSVGETFNFDELTPFEEVVDYFLFDTKGKERGGNGVTFNWQLLGKCSSTKPYFLSGGIGLEELDNLLLFLQSKESTHCIAIDVNSKFEIEAGLKSVDKISKFKRLLVEGLKADSIQSQLAVKKQK